VHETARRAFEEREAASGLLTITVTADRIREGVPLADLMVAAGLATSKSDARRLICGGGARLNDHAITNEAMRLTEKDASNGIVKLSAGRKRHALIRLV
jgi:tyrosyl-tRNA synthetase